MEYLYKFNFSNGEIFEIKYTDLPKTAPKSERFKWFIKLNNNTQELEFITMTTSTRKFKMNETEINLDMENLTIKIGQTEYKLI